MNKKLEPQVDYEIQNLLNEKRKYSEKWFSKKHTSPEIENVFKKASKKENNKEGFPDLIYLNEKNKLFIIVENKRLLRNHKNSSKKNNPSKYAIDGVMHYLKFIPNEYKTIGIAFAGDLDDVKLLSTFIKKEDKVFEIDVSEFLNEVDYLSLFSNFNKEEAIKKISKSAKSLNTILRQIVETRNRPLLLASLIICLYRNEEINNSFPDIYKKQSPNELIANIIPTVESVLKQSGVPNDKINIIINTISFIKINLYLKKGSVVFNMLKDLEENVLPLLTKIKSYDIIGKFYQEFLKYAGVADVKKGIVLTPEHVTDLFVDILEITKSINTSDTIFDGACGTGGFLISAMNKMIKLCNGNDAMVKKIKKHQLYGSDVSTLMYTLSMSNMLFRGDGKSNVIHKDLFEIDKENEYDIGLLNPPYAGKDNKDNRTKKEIQFIEKMLKITKKKFVVIAPISTFFTENKIREKILEEHTLDMVINMPKSIFEPVASTHTAIAVFTVNIPHNNKKVYLYNLEDDGFIITKNKGRSDILSKWNEIKKELLNDIKERKEIPFKAINTHIYSKNTQEWLIQDHIDVDYSGLRINDFEKTLKDFSIFKLKEKYNLINKKNLSEIDILEIISKEWNGK